MHKTAIIQARMNSTRLPGKVLAEVMGKPLLAYQLERVRRSNAIDRIVVATTRNPEDDAIIYLCRRMAVDYFRGSESDVLGRFAEAAREFGADIIVRLTGDCPLIDPAVIDRVIDYLLEHADTLDYVSNVLDRTYPRGMDAEAFTSAALERANREACSPAEREHVTPYLYRHPELFKLASLKHGEDLSSFRLTVDTPEDFRLIGLILTNLYPVNRNFDLEHILAQLKQNPEWLHFNQNIKQKETGE